MTKPLDDSWQKYPEARIRMRDDGVKTILEGLGPDGFCTNATTRVSRVDEGIYVDILLNSGKHGNIIALPLEILIPAEMLPEPTKKKKSKKKKEAVEEPVKETVPVTDSPEEV